MKKYYLRIMSGAQYVFESKKDLLKIMVTKYSRGSVVA